MKKIVVSNECVACGICVPMSDFLEELPNGKVIAKGAGSITDQEAKSFNEVIEACPVRAISVEQSGLVKNRGKEGIADLKNLIQNKFKHYRVQKPSSSQYRFRAREYQVPYVSASGERRYDYKSDDKAEQAGLREFDRVMYSQKRALIQQILVEYKHHKLRPFNCYEEAEGNFYYQVVSEIEKALNEFITEAKDLTNNQVKLPSGFERFKPNMDFSDKGSIAVYQLRNIEKINIVDQISDRLDSLYEYKLYVNTDDIDTGKRYMSCYDLREVITTFGRDILSEISDVCDDFVDMNMEIATREFNEAVEKELKNKMKVLSEALNSKGLEVKDDSLIPIIYK